MKEQSFLRKFSSVLSVVSLLFAPSAPADVYLGFGRGIFHTDGTGFQIAASVYRNVEVHYTTWDDGLRVRAAGVGYRFDNGSPVSVVLGAAYVDPVTSNLLRGANAYVELRVGPFEHFSCQIAHYSSVGDDNGENVLLCGLQWEWRAGSD